MTLPLVRKRGFAIDDQRTETGLTAVAVPVRAPDGSALASIALALPSARFQPGPGDGVGERPVRDRDGACDIDLCCCYSFESGK